MDKDCTRDKDGRFVKVEDGRVITFEQYELLLEDRNHYQRALREEIEGVRQLRKKYGARPGETFIEFIDRLAARGTIMAMQTKVIALEIENAKLKEELKIPHDHERETIIACEQDSTPMNVDQGQTGK